MTQIEIKNNYLWLPVRTGDEMCRLTVMLAGQTVYGLDIEAADGPADFYAMLERHWHLTVACPQGGWRGLSSMKLFPKKRKTTRPFTSPLTLGG